MLVGKDFDTGVMAEPQTSKTGIIGPSSSGQPSTELQQVVVEPSISNIAPPRYLVQDVDAPPDFAPYEAEYFEDGSGNVVSHDPHLNTDGEALYRFLLSQSETRPALRIHCRGTHTEHRDRWVTHSTSDGGHESRRESYTETVTDFDFYIDVRPPAASKPVQWTIADDAPTYRGLMIRQSLHFPDAPRNSTRQEQKQYQHLAEQRIALGLPPWSTRIDLPSNTIPSEAEALKSSKTLRQWADEYCASPKYLKEFVFDKTPFGWNIESLESKIRDSIRRTFYYGSLEVDIRSWASKVYVRPDNGLSRMLSNKWLKFLSIILLIFPFIWLFKRFHSCGGGQWRVAGCAYALYSPQGQADHSTGLLSKPTPGQARRIGITEDEWFRRREAMIIHSVNARTESRTPIVDVIEEDSI